MIHSTTIVSEKAKIGANTKIGAFTIIEDDVVIGDNCDIRSSVVISNGARIGNNVKIFPSASIAAEPQDLKYKNELTEVFIGDNTVLREFSTVNRGTTATGKTVVGKNCLIMTYSHVAHDCVVGDNVIMSNATQLAGHVTIHDWAILGGVVKVHQFCKIGAHTMVGADSKIVKDVPPFVLIGKEPLKVERVNKIGLQRRGFSSESIKKIDKFYRDLLRKGQLKDKVIENYRTNETLDDNLLYCIDFIQSSDRGIYR